MNVICKQWTENFEVNGCRIDDILCLIKESYLERAKEGIVFDTLNYTIDDFMAECSDADYWFLAFDDNSHLNGTARMTIKDNWGEICNFAVLPQCQGKQVGSQLLQTANQFAKEKNLDHIMSYTAMKAVSSVKCHCKNDYKIIGICVGVNRCFSSYKFRNQLTQSFFWNSSTYIKTRYSLSYLLYRLAKKSDGNNTKMGDLMLFCKKYLVKN